jgi:hypothetical protein
LPVRPQVHPVGQRGETALGRRRGVRDVEPRHVRGRGDVLLRRPEDARGHVRRVLYRLGRAVRHVPIRRRRARSQQRAFRRSACRSATRSRRIVPRIEVATGMPETSSACRPARRPSPANRSDERLRARLGVHVRARGAGGAAVCGAAPRFATLLRTTRAPERRADRSAFRGTRRERPRPLVRMSASARSPPLRGEPIVGEAVLDR